MTTESDFARLDEHRKHRFLSFDPKFTTGDLLQMVVVLAAIAGGYGVYTADKATTAKELEHVKAGVLTDRVVNKEQLAEVKAEVKETRSEVKDVLKAVNEIKTSVAGIEARQGAAPRSKP